MANTMSREAFEAWPNPGHHAGNVSPWVEPGRYQKETHQLAWLAWKAAQADAFERAAKVCHQMSIEQKGMGYSGRTCSIRNQRAAECRDAIRALEKENKR